MPLVLGSAQANAAILDDDTCPTLTAQMGTGGNNMPLVLMDQGGGVMSVEHDKVGTLRAQTHGHEPLVLAVHENQLSECRLSEVSPPLQTPSGKAGRGLPVVLQEAYRISSDASNCMRSANPLTGFKQTDLSPTLDTVDPSPSKAQGGLAIVVAENVIGRSEKNGPQGKGWTEDKCFTLNSTGVHAVLPPVPHCFKLRSGKEGGGKGYLGQDDKTFTLATTIDQFLMTNEPMPINTQVVQGRPSDNGRMGSGIGKPGDPANTLQANHSHGVFDMQARVRKLTPTECERLQGFPDGWTKIPFRGKDAENCPDSPRYKAIGNSWAVPCVRWIGERIDKEVKK